ncbi:speckle-type POZ protein B-like [Trichogramma pretiosum]|uniref:speckle-type POZ protein B-like n=1 Tax=Trichogramma pretiosum TaxID=7493 RepID=UPI0006C94470|nr:speckle-type POZ protein B-like [Trichogramma pretiosum]
MSKDHKIMYCSQSNTEYFDCTWVIRDYLANFSKKTDIYSPYFKIGNNQETLRFNIYRLTKTSMVTLSLEVSGPTICGCSYKISVIKDDQIAYTRIDEALGTVTVFNIDAKDVNEFISSSGTLTIHCKLTISTGEMEHVLINESVDKNQALVPKFNFDWIFLEENFSDVNLRAACGKEIPAHRVILANASSVFKAMFSHDMLENKSQLVDMIDVSHPAAVEMLRYIYTGSVVETQEFSLTAEVLAAADKYQLEGLKNVCEKMFISTLSTENAIEALTIAKKYNINKLKIKAVEFLKHKISESPNSDEAGDMIFSMIQFLSK